MSSSNDLIEKLIEKLNSPNFKVTSQFLEEYYNEKKKENIKRLGFDPRDPDGMRLSSFWGPGDTIFTVTLKKFFSKINIFMDPNTYTMKNYKEYRRKIQMYDFYLFGFAGILSMMALIIVPFILPRIKQARTNYLLNQYLKKKWMEDELQLGKKEIRLYKMKRILKKQNEEFN